MRGERKASFLFPQKLPSLACKICIQYKDMPAYVHATSRCRKLKKIYLYIYIYIFIYVSMPIKYMGPKSTKKDGMSTWL